MRLPLRTVLRSVVPMIVPMIVSMVVIAQGNRSSPRSRRTCSSLPLGMRVELATVAVLPDVHMAYQAGRATQHRQQSPVWPPFSDAAIMREIEAGSLYCVRDGSGLAGVFSMLDADPIIWGAAERGEHLYLHRIARASSHPGRGLIAAVLDWAFEQCARRGRCGLRMDTWASNEALVALYVARGFHLVDTRVMPADPRLSAHYHGIELALLEARCATQDSVRQGE